MRHSNKEYAARVLKLLKRRYGRKVGTSLHHLDAWELLVATILSAQSQDVKVNQITPKLFRRFRTLGSFAAATPGRVYPYVKTLGLYRSKARNIIGAARAIRGEFGSRVPQTMGELTTLPGVGRKTANVVLNDAFGISTGIAIDTHCITVSGRVFLVGTRNPERIERALMEIFPKQDWGDVSNLLIALGRDTCQARRKYCGRCVLGRICPSSDEKVKD